jgi:hypothetical protein
VGRIIPTKVSLNWPPFWLAAVSFHVSQARHRATYRPRFWSNLHLQLKQWTSLVVRHAAVLQKRSGTSCRWPQLAASHIDPQSIGYVKPVIRQRWILCEQLSRLLSRSGKAVAASPSSAALISLAVAGMAFCQFSSIESPLRRYAACFFDTGNHLIMHSSSRWASEYCYAFRTGLKLQAKVGCHWTRRRRFNASFLLGNPAGGCEGEQRPLFLARSKISRSDSAPWHWLVCISQTAMSARASSNLARAWLFGFPLQSPAGLVPELIP